MQEVEEFWVPVVGYEGYYEISNLLNMRSLQRVVKRKDGFNRIVNAKTVLSDKSTVCLAKDNVHLSHNPISLAVKSFYHWYDPEYHYHVALQKNDVSRLYERQVFYKPEHNPLKIVMATGELLKFDNIYEAASHFKRSIDSMCEFIFKENRTNKLCIDSITFRHPYYYKGQVKIVKHMSIVNKTQQKRLARQAREETRKQIEDVKLRNKERREALKAYSGTMVRFR